MKKLLVALGFSLLALTSFQASALVIDTNAGWDGNINSGWDGSGQSLTVDTTENFFNSIGFYFDQASNGRNFSFRLSDALNGGATLFSTSFTVGAGINTININQFMTAGTQIYALLDYNGFSGATAHFSSNNTYAGGHSVFLSGGTYDGSFATLDHRFIAQFSRGVQVPEPAMLALFGLGLAGLGIARKKRS